MSGCKRVWGFIAASLRTLLFGKTCVVPRAYALHPTNEDLFAGAPGLGYFLSLAAEVGLVEAGNRKAGNRE